MLKRLAIACAVSATLVGYAQADIDSFPYAAGLQGNGGLSFKAQLNPDFAAQLIADPFGSYNRIIARGIFDLEEGPFWKAYGYADGGLHLSDETSEPGLDTIGIGAGVGAGLQYDIRGLAPELPPVAMSFDLGGAAIFYNNDVPINITYSFGLHYHFGR